MVLLTCALPNLLLWTSVNIVFNRDQVIGKWLKACPVTASRIAAWSAALLPKYSTVLQCIYKGSLEKWVDIFRWNIEYLGHCRTGVSPRACKNYRIYSSKLSRICRKEARITKWRRSVRICKILALNCWAFVNEARKSVQGVHKNCWRMRNFSHAEICQSLINLQDCNREYCLNIELIWKSSFLKHLNAFIKGEIKIKDF